MSVAAAVSSRTAAESLLAADNWSSLGLHRWKSNMGSVASRSTSPVLQIAPPPPPPPKQKQFLSLWQVADRCAHDCQWVALQRFAQNNLLVWHAEQRRARSTTRGVREKHFAAINPFGALGVLHDHTNTMLHKFIVQLNAQFVNRKGDEWEVPVRYRSGEENLDRTVANQRASALAHPRVAAAIQRLWAVFPKDHRGGLTHDVHQIIFTSIFRVLAFDLWETRELQRLVSVDWACRAEGRPAINEEIFFASSVVMCDAWCETVEVDEVVEFVGMLTRIAQDTTEQRRDELSRATETREFGTVEDKNMNRSHILRSLGRKNVQVGAGADGGYTAESLVSFVCALAKGQIEHFETRTVKASAVPDPLPDLAPTLLLPLRQSPSDAQQQSEAFPSPSHHRSSSLLVPHPEAHQVRSSSLSSSASSSTASSIVLLSSNEEPANDQVRGSFVVHSVGRSQRNRRKRRSTQKPGPSSFAAEDDAHSCSNDLVDRDDVDDAQLVQDFTFIPTPKADKTQKYKELMRLPLHELVPHVAEAMVQHPSAVPGGHEASHDERHREAALLGRHEDDDDGGGAAPREPTVAEVDAMMQQYTVLAAIAAPKRMLAAFAKWRGSMHCSSNNLFPSFSPRCTGTVTSIDARALRSFALPMRVPFHWFIQASDAAAHSWVALGTAADAALTAMWFDGAAEPLVVPLPPEYLEAADAADDADDDDEKNDGRDHPGDGSGGGDRERRGGGDARRQRLTAPSGAPAAAVRVFMNDVTAELLDGEAFRECQSRPSSSQSRSASRGASPATTPIRHSLLARYDYMWEYENTTCTSWIPFDLDVQAKLTALLARLPVDRADTAVADGVGSRQGSRGSSMTLSGQQAGEGAGVRGCEPVRSRVTSARTTATVSSSSSRSPRSRVASAQPRRVGVLRLSGELVGAKGTTHDVDIGEGLLVSWVRSRCATRKLRCATLVVDSRHPFAPQRFAADGHEHLMHCTVVGEGPSVREAAVPAALPRVPAARAAVLRLPRALRAEAGVTAALKARTSASVLCAEVHDSGECAATRPQELSLPSCAPAAASASPGVAGKKIIGDPNIEQLSDPEVGYAGRAAPSTRPHFASSPSSSSQQLVQLLTPDAPSISTRYVTRRAVDAAPAPLSRTRIERLAHRGRAIVSGEAVSGVGAGSAAAAGPATISLHSRHVVPARNSPLRGRHIRSGRYCRTGGGMASYPRVAPDDLLAAAKKAVVSLNEATRAICLDEATPSVGAGAGGHSQPRAMTPSSYCRRRAECLSPASRRGPGGDDHGFEPLLLANARPERSDVTHSFARLEESSSGVNLCVARRVVAPSRALTPGPASSSKGHRHLSLAAPHQMAKRVAGSLPQPQRASLPEGLGQMLGTRVTTPAANLRLLSQPADFEFFP